MIISDVSLPYPVLGIEDNVMPLPETRPTFHGDERRYTFIFDFVMENEEIQRYIDLGLAEYVCEVNCKDTFIRECFRSKTPHIEITYKRNELMNEISFQNAIVVKGEIQGYTNKGFHEDYAGYSFNLGSGDVLAYLGEYTYDAGIKYDKLQAVKTFMEIKSGREGDDMKFNLSTDKIEILLPPDMYEDYKVNILNDRTYNSILISSLVYNTLMYALYNFEENSHTLWARSISYRMDNEKGLEKYDITDSTQIPAIVNALLKDPYRKLFHSLNNIKNNLEEED